MKAVQKLVLVLSVLALGACSMQQDPLSNAPEAVKNGVPPGQGSQNNEKPVPKDALQIDAPSLVNSKIGSEIKFEIKGRVLVPKVDFTLQIENLAAYPGATFDATTGVFKWTPSADVISNGITGQVNLVVQLITLQGPTNFPVSMERKSITLNLFRNFNKPVVSFVSTSGTYTVGNKYTLNIELEDADSTLPADFNLIFGVCSSSSGSVNLSPAVKYQSSSFTKDAATGKYIGTLDLDLSGQVFPYDTNNFCFSVKSYSQFGAQSDAYDVELNVKNPLKETASSTTAVSIKKGTISDVSFSFFDPMQIGTIYLINTPNAALISPRSFVKCITNTQFGANIINCTLTVDATNLQVGSRTLKFDLQNSKYPQDAVTSTSTITVNIVN